ncbi:hypothetical protein TNCV_2210031 [Trichonephila clavipes]|nr:hypothetical protein TNCV_2210031 [Trichonephila clavipes]
MSQREDRKTTNASSENYPFLKDDIPVFLPTQYAAYHFGEPGCFFKQANRRTARKNYRITYRCESTRIWRRFTPRSRRRKITSCPIYVAENDSSREEKYSSYELEVLAVVNALKKFPHLPSGKSFLKS